MKFVKMAVLCLLAPIILLSLTAHLATYWVAKILFNLTVFFCTEETCYLTFDDFWNDF